VILVQLNTFGAQICGCVGKKPRTYFDEIQHISWYLWRTV